MADAAAGGDEGAVATPPTPQMEGAAAEEGDAAVTTPPPPPTCPVCMEPWNCNGNHRICCIPCGHVYGRSCLERWLRRCGDDGAKCPQCGEHFEDELITNLYAPGNLWDGCCRLQELKTHHESLIHEMERCLKSIIVEYKAKMESAAEELKANLVKSFTVVAGLEGQLAEFQDTLDQIVRMRNEEKATSNANLMAMKERMKKIAEEENATVTELIECVELSFPQLSPISNPHASASAPAPVDSQNNRRRHRNRPENLPPVPAPPGPAYAASKRRRRGT